PAMDGITLCRRFARLRPETELLLMSGTPDGIEHPPELPVVAKPFTPHTLLQRVRQIIPVLPQSQPALRAADRLWEEEKRARSEWLKMMAECDALLKQVPSGIPHPDGALRIQRAGVRR